MRNTVLVLLMGLAGAVVLAEAYAAAGEYWPLWLAAAVINTFLALIIIVAIKRLGRPDPEVRLDWPPLPYPYAFAPGVLLLLVAGVMACVSRFFFAGNGRVLDVGDFLFASILWVPLVEEVVFRVGVGGLVRRFLGLWPGVYLSALFFALAHALPTFSRISGGSIGIPAGAFLLGLINELIYVRYRRLAPAVFFHAAGNLVGVIFWVIDPRWLSWLRFMFL